MFETFDESTPKKPHTTRHLLKSTKFLYHVLMIKKHILNNEYDRLALGYQS